MDAEHAAPETSHSNYLLSFLGAVGSLLLFAFILFLAYLPNRPPPVDQEIVNSRLENLAQTRATQRDLASSYGWVNRQEGVVRIPTERAMELAIARLAADQPLYQEHEAPSAQGGAR